MAEMMKAVQVQGRASRQRSVTEQSFEVSPRRRRSTTTIMPNTITAAATWIISRPENPPCDWDTKIAMGVFSSQCRNGVIDCTMSSPRCEWLWCVDVVDLTLQEAHDPASATRERYANPQDEGESRKSACRHVF